MEQREKTFNVWTEPFEGASTNSNNNNTWWVRRVLAMLPAQEYVSEYIATFKDFPPRQKPAKSNFDDELATLKSASGNN